MPIAPGTNSKASIQLRAVDIGRTNEFSDVDPHIGLGEAYAAMSPSTWWAARMILGEVAAMPVRRSVRVYLDSGVSNDNTALLDRALLDVGYVEGQSLRYVVQPGGEHSERYWAERLPGALSFLLGRREHTAP